MRELSILDHRVPKWDMTAVMERVCPICAQEPKRAIFRRPDGLSVHLCESCTTYFVNPAPSADDLVRLYDSYDSSHSRNALSLHESHLLLESTHPLDDLRVRELSTYLDIARSRILDVGFGRGGLMYQLKRLGADVHGVDPDASAHAFARALGIEGTLHGDLRAIDPSLRFDAVMLNDVIEHPLDPLALLRACTERLAPGGILLLWTPNGGSIARSADPVMLRVDLEHLQYFTTDTCIRIAGMLGLRIVHLETVGRIDADAYAGAQAPEAARNRRVRMLRQAGRRVVKSLPGFVRVTALRRDIRRMREGSSAHAATMDNRCGEYNLLCLLRTP